VAGRKITLVSPQAELGSTTEESDQSAPAKAPRRPGGILVLAARRIESMPKPRILVTRRIPAAALARMEQSATLEVWPHSDPPPPEHLPQLVGPCTGPPCLLTDRIDRPLLD